MRDLKMRLQEQWAIETLQAHPEFIRDSNSPEELYSYLCDEWFKDVQPALKSLFRRCVYVPEVTEKIREND